MRLLRALTVPALALAYALAACSGPGPALYGSAPGARAQRVGTSPQAQIVVEARAVHASVSADVFGANVGTWYDFTQPFVEPAMRAAGVALVRFPGGSQSDIYHWEHGRPRLRRVC